MIEPPIDLVTRLMVRLVWGKTSGGATRSRYEIFEMTESTLRLQPILADSKKTPREEVFTRVPGELK